MKLSFKLSNSDKSKDLILFLDDYNFNRNKENNYFLERSFKGNITWPPFPIPIQCSFRSIGDNLKIKLQSKFNYTVPIIIVVIINLILIGFSVWDFSWYKIYAAMLLTLGVFVYLEFIFLLTLLYWKKRIKNELLK